MLHAASAPLLLYRPRADRRQGAEFSTIVVPLDGSPMAETVLPHAEALAGAMGLGVHLIRVTSTLIEYYAGEGFYTYPGDLIAEMDREALRYLEAKSAELKKRGVRKVTTQHLTGAAAIQIVDAVKNLPGRVVGQFDWATRVVEGGWGYGVGQYHHMPEITMDTTCKIAA